jgi:carbon storage regulator
MLVITRKLGEEIIIADKIRIRVVAVKGERVRIGVEAPKFIPVDRLEIHQRRAEFEELTDSPEIVLERSE